MKKLLGAFLFLVGMQAHATNYYVSSSGSDSNNGTSSSTPFATIQKAADLTNPGDVVNIMNGTYTQTEARYGNWLTSLYIFRSGTASAYITYQAYPGHTPVISAVNGKWNCLVILARYIKVIGLELVGKNQSTTLAEAEANYNYAVATTDAGGTVDWDRLGLIDINGVTIGQGSEAVVHHVEIRNCKIHDFAGSGIGVTNSDYITLEGNTVYNNSWYTMWACSGITFINNANSDSKASLFKLITRGNKVYNNYCLVKWFQTRDYSDGNGIIIDVHTRYRAKHLVENNLVFDNGGRGLYIMSAKNATFRNNISYWNSKSSFASGGEMVAYDARNVTFVNNIAWANPAYSSNNFALNDDGAWGSNSNIVWKNNITFNGTVGQSSVNLNKTTTTSIDNTNILGVNPLLVSPSTSPSADFRPQSTSPAIGVGTSAYGTFTTDIVGNPRVVGTIDMGCYENQSILKSAVIASEIESANTGLALSIFPNPVTNGKLTISFNENQGNAEISIVDLQGKQLYKVSLQGAGIYNINTSDILKSGMYFIKVQSETLHVTQKLIVK